MAMLHPSFYSSVLCVRVLGAGGVGVGVGVGVVAFKRRDAHVVPVQANRTFVYCWCEKEHTYADTKKMKYTRTASGQSWSQ